jgi:hypothetical protein
MNVFSATLVCLALTAAPAAAETQYQSTMSGNVKVEVAPQDANAAQPKPGDTLTVHFVPPPKQPADVEDDPAEKLRQCGDKWNKKLAEYNKHVLPKLKKYLAYNNKWGGYPAQRPPTSDEPLLTRASYRACIYACLGDTTVACPGGWPAEAADKK